MEGYRLYVSETKIIKPALVRKILSKHFSTVTFEVTQAKKGAAAMLTGEPWDYGPAEVNNYDWPHATKWELIEDVADELYEDFLRQHGDTGFVELLLELSPYLKAQLIIQATYQNPNGKTIMRELLPNSINPEPYEFVRQNSIYAKEWYVAPNATEVEVNAFRHYQSPL
jgi:hypothetical protein